MYYLFRLRQDPDTRFIVNTKAKNFNQQKPDQCNPYAYFGERFHMISAVIHLNDSRLLE